MPICLINHRNFLLPDFSMFLSRSSSHPHRYGKCSRRRSTRTSQRRMINVAELVSPFRDQFPSAAIGTHYPFNYIDHWSLATRRRSVKVKMGKTKGGRQPHADQRMIDRMELTCFFPLAPSPLMKMKWNLILGLDSARADMQNGKQLTIKSCSHRIDCCFSLSVRLFFCVCLSLSFLTLG